MFPMKLGRIRVGAASIRSEPSLISSVSSSANARTRNNPGFSNPKGLKNEAGARNNV